ncbi:MAG TPA: S41 family peptidase [Acidobacteriaceae bacterium]|nr:S41 family peptidase [Acidobacteriaceae bacterium]
MPKALKLSLLAVSVLLVLFVFLGGIMPGGVRASSEATAYQQIEVYSEVLQHIQNDYVVTPNIADVTTGSLHGLLEGLDPDSSYLTPAEFRTYQAHQNESKAQIGVDVSKRFGYATVVSVVPGSPADKAGLIDGDWIESIGGKSTRVMPLQMIQMALNGDPGTSVNFSLIQPTSTAPAAMTLTRSLTAYPALHTDEYENSSILYLKPFDLQKERVDELLTKVSQVQKSGQQKILLDLRDVSSGDMDSAVRLASAFLKPGSTIATLEGQKFPQQIWKADAKNTISAAAPLIVLVNHGTAGPAEIVAAALKDNNRAQLVGDRTFGMGSVQKQIPLPDGAVLFLSVAKYRGPNGKVIQKEAVTPNVIVASNENFGEESAAPAQGVKPAVPRGPAPGLSPSIAPVTPGKSGNMPQKPAATQPDLQLQKALSILKLQKAAA